MAQRLALLAALVLAFATGAAADKAITYFTLMLTDVTVVRFERNPTSPSGWLISAQGTVRASSGQGYTTFIAANASAAQKTTIENFITNTVLPALNTQEGL